ncbi:MAG: phosphatidylglycerophosphatase A [Alphaproteobacteria bacterium]|nr:phosphatidylglycerophosphatase A [Alphaproteobacteria bacterium]
MRPASFIASLFGIGYIPFASGTWASLVALFPAFGLMYEGGPGLLGLSVGVVSILGIWACDVHVRTTGRHDPSECVIDEVAGQWLACMAAPLSLPGYVLAFAAFRFFDILKPWPASTAERAPGGLGVMMDDLVAGIMAAVLIAAIHATGLV